MILRTRVRYRYQSYHTALKAEPLAVSIWFNSVRKTVKETILRQTNRNILLLTVLSFLMLSYSFTLSREKDHPKQNTSTNWYYKSNQQLQCSREAWKQMSTHKVTTQVFRFHKVTTQVFRLEQRDLSIRLALSRGHDVPFQLYLKAGWPTLFCKECSMGYPSKTRF